MEKCRFILFLILTTFMSCDSWDKDSYPIIERRFKLSQNGMNDVMLKRNDNNTIVIYGHILLYGSNADYIIIQEKPRDSISGSENLRFEEKEKKFEESKFSQYWIIKLENDSLLGPYNKIEYLEMRQVTGVPEKLKLDHSTREIYIQGQRNDVGYINMDSDVVDIKNLKGNNFSKVFSF